MGKRMGWTRIIVCHEAHVITNVQTHLICCLTCFLHGVVMHGCVTLARLMASTPSTLGLAACGHTIEQKAATGAIAGAVVAGPVGAAVGGAAGAAVGHIDKPHR